MHNDIIELVLLAHQITPFKDNEIAVFANIHPYFAQPSLSQVIAIDILILYLVG
jgi:hypothetical protein